MPTERAHAALVETPETRAHLERLRTVTLWLDQRLVDPLLGLLLPGVGDTLGALLGLYGVYVGARLHVHPVVLARMLLNLGLDALLGAVPLLGAVVDFFFRAHSRNLRLLEERGSSGEPTRGDWLVVGGAVGAFLVALSLPVILAALLVYAAARLLFG